MDQLKIKIVKVILLLTAASEKGNPYASFLLGLIYEKGHFIEKDKKKYQTYKKKIYFIYLI